MKVASLFAAALMLSGGAALADHWPNRPAVLRAAEVLQEEVEHFDEAMHGVDAPAHVIQKVHHFEETVTDFVEGLRGSMGYDEAYHEMEHIREDVVFIRNELNAHPHLLANPRVSQEWRHVRSAYRNLDHQMFNHIHGRLGVSERETLAAEMAELEAAH